MTRARHLQGEGPEEAFTPGGDFGAQNNNALHGGRRHIWHVSGGPGHGACARDYLGGSEEHSLRRGVPGNLRCWVHSEGKTPTALRS